MFIIIHQGSTKQSHNKMPLHTYRMAKIKNVTQQIPAQMHRNLVICVADRNKWDKYSGKRFGSFLKNETVIQPQQLHFLTFTGHFQNKSCIHTKSCTRTFIAALFVIVKN
jgi:hypothetical protein